MSTTKFLLLCGVSGVGKSTIIDELIRLDGKFTYISPFMNRPLRPGEKNKIFITDGEMDAMDLRGELLVINPKFGFRYATPRITIENTFAQERFPVLDWPIDKYDVMTRAFPGRLFTVYIAPPSINVLAERLDRDGRDANGTRLQEAMIELGDFWSGHYDDLIDFSVISEEGQISHLAEKIYKTYLKNIQHA